MIWANYNTDNNVSTLSAIVYHIHTSWNQTNDDNLISMCSFYVVSRVEYEVVCWVKGFMSVHILKYRESGV